MIKVVVARAYYNTFQYGEYFIKMLATNRATNVLSMSESALPNPNLYPRQFESLTSIVTTHTYLTSRCINEIITILSEHTT
jgi:hypothetical protein